MGWRPDDWVNPHKGVSAWAKESIGPPKQWLIDSTFEAGADAMYESMLSLIERLGYKRVANDIRLYAGLPDKEENNVRES